MIFGNVEGIKDNILEELEDLYEYKISKDTLADEYIINLISKITGEINREISVAINRRGQVISIAIGDSNTVQTPDIDIKEKRLSGIRIIHTHTSGSSKLSVLDISVLLKFKLDCIAAIGVKEGKCNEVSIGFCSIKDDKLHSKTTDVLKLEEALNYDIFYKINYIDNLIRDSNIEENYGERAVLVGINDKESLFELGELAKACNLEVVGTLFQRKDKIDTAFYIGKGKVEELILQSQINKANIVIFDNELSGSQVKNLEDILGIKVIDRTVLILEIFAKRAKSREAKIQVESARLNYMLSRLEGFGTLLSKTGGGIGTRGPGEQKLEIDRRRIRNKLHELDNELKNIKKTRKVQRDKRNKGNIPKVSLVGYTNSGKSTLRNKLYNLALPKDANVKKDVFESKILFATLEVTTRAIVLPDNRLVTITDTVGFIKKLPHDIIEAFKSTLEEVVYSDLLLHVVDVSNINAIEQINTVNQVLKEIGVKDKPILLVLNKIDKASDKDISNIKRIYKNYDIIEISAKENINLEQLLDKISKMIPSTLTKVKYIIPYANQDVVAYLHRNAIVDFEKFLDEGTYIEAQVNDEVYNKCINYLYIDN